MTSNDSMPDIRPPAPGRPRYAARTLATPGVLTPFKLADTRAASPVSRPRSRFGRVRVLVLVVVGAVLVLPAFEGRAPAQSANEFLVTSTADKPDADVIDDVCDADPGPAVECTLRAAVMQANLSGGQQVIRLQPRVYRLTIPGADEDQASTGDLDLAGAVHLVGTAGGGRARSTIDATGLADRVLDVAGSGPSDVSIQNLVVSGGALPASSDTSDRFAGGGIRNRGRLKLSDSLVQDNVAARGGGIYGEGSELKIERSTIRANRALSHTAAFVDGGGGIMTQSFEPFTLRDSTVEDNTSAGEAGGVSASAITNVPKLIERSLIAGNIAQTDGGGVSFNQDDRGRLGLLNSTLSANGAGQDGGALHTRVNHSTGIPVVLNAVTVAGNRARPAGGALESPTDTKATSTLIANNIGGNCATGFKDSTFNLSSDSTCGFGDSTSLSDVTARLAPLQFNGSLTRTHALLADSPAINAGPLRGLCHPNDQRGGIRPTWLNLLDPGVDPCDIGAFELTAVNVPG